MPADPLPWPPGAATGVGSLPGTDPAEAARLVAGELPDLLHLPELPARGVGADLVGRGAALLADLHVDLQPSGWRLVARPGLDERRSRDLLQRDLDALGEVAGDYPGPVKLQAAGVWTLAASLELTRGDKALADPGAVRDLAVALAEGLAAHVADLRRRLPAASAVLVQLDEPSLPLVLAGRVPVASGFGTLRVVEESTAEEHLRAVLTAGAGADAVPGVHSCAADVPVRLLTRAGARFVGLDASLLTPAYDDPVGEAVEAGVGLLLGVVPALGPGVPPTVRSAAVPARGLWHRLGFPPEQLASVVAVTPACGLAGASTGWVNTALRLCRQVGRALAESPDEAVEAVER